MPNRNLNSRSTGSAWPSAQTTGMADPSVTMRVGGDESTGSPAVSSTCTSIKLRPGSALPHETSSPTGVAEGLIGIVVIEPGISPSGVSSAANPSIGSDASPVCAGYTLPALLVHSPLFSEGQFVQCSGWPA